jgi:hypothetical protein
VKISQQQFINPLNLTKNPVTRSIEAGSPTSVVNPYSSPFLFQSNFYALLFYPEATSLDLNTLFSPFCTPAAGRWETGGVDCELDVEKIVLFLYE